jgi:hypothetical protein
MPDFDFDAFNHEDYSEDGSSTSTEGGAESSADTPQVAEDKQNTSAGSHSEDVDKW